MDLIEVAGSKSGALVPLHLLSYEGIPDLQSFYRSLIEDDYYRGLEKYELGQCHMCGFSLSFQDGPRLKPSKFRFTKRIRDLLSKQASGCQLRKVEDFVLQRYLNSQSHMIVKCSYCGTINKKAVLSNKQKRDLKTKQRMAITDDSHIEESPVVQLSKSQRKKQKRRNKKADLNSGLIIPTSMQPYRDDKAESEVSKSQGVENECLQNNEGKKLQNPEQSGEGTTLSSESIQNPAPTSEKKNQPQAATSSLQNSDRLKLNSLTPGTSKGNTSHNSRTQKKQKNKGKTGKVKDGHGSGGANSNKTQINREKLQAFLADSQKAKKKTESSLTDFLSLL